MTKKNLYMFSTDTTIIGLTIQYASAIVFLNIFDLCLLESADVEPTYGGLTIFAYGCPVSGKHGSGPALLT